MVNGKVLGFCFGTECDRSDFDRAFSAGTFFSLSVVREDLQPLCQFVHRQRMDPSSLTFDLL